MRVNKIKRALISVTNKQGIASFAKELTAMGVEIISTGGTAKQLREEGINVVDVSDYTGFPEMMEGRLKTLHPRIHGGLLARRDNHEDINAMNVHGIGQIDLAVINLYQFEQTVSDKSCTLEKAIENIDIGGPTMLRAAAKNYRFVSVVIDPADYPAIIAEMKEAGGISEETNFALMQKTFQATAKYDAAISNYLGKIQNGMLSKQFPDTLTLQFALAQGLRYGENPHQKAAFYREADINFASIATAHQLQGKELSYNNIMDADAAWQMVGEFDEAAAIIVKHANPCGAAITNGELVEAYLKALASDPVSAFGGIVAFNRPVDEKVARELSKIFLEVIVAPTFTKEALAILNDKKNVRLLEVGGIGKPLSTYYDFRRVLGGLLVQDKDNTPFDIRSAKIVTNRVPTNAEYQGMDFAWRIVKNVKSNAIVFTSSEQLIGVGAGQMSRVDSVKIAIMKSIPPTKGCYLASDAFFPFRDGIDLAAQAGITAIVQPGGSLRDEEAITAANEHNMAMLFTGMRHFKH